MIVLSATVRLCLTRSSRVRGRATASERLNDNRRTRGGMIRRADLVERMRSLVRADASVDAGRVEDFAAREAMGGRDSWRADISPAHGADRAAT
ncbi:hypothetical protein [Paraburkholderia aromaticivorans]|uniref:hypothetical protein n=1 Tax=Paraburkholderia aromaticivorans TaxID=2026199 RepID=UPI0014560716|nr:hypothetical protein [Paraburkholderia aromaticivorans]